MDDIDLISNKIKGCKLCRLHEKRTNAVPGEGDSKAKVVLIGEAPGKQEDKAGRPFVGRAGELLNELLRSIDLSREEVFITNMVKCRPPDNRDPRKDEKETCSSYLQKQLNLIDPQVIVTLGNHATGAFIGEGEMKKRHGEEFIHEGKKLIPMYHPAAALYNPNLKSTMKEDMEMLNKQL